MESREVWYSIEKGDNIWVVWKNVESKGNQKGGLGFRGIFQSVNRRDCVNFCKENGIKTSRKR